MKHSFSRFFGLGEKEQEPEIAEHDTNKEEILEIPVNAIVPNRFQPRTIFSDEKIKELAMTIHTHGIIQPIVVRHTEEEKANTNSLQVKDAGERCNRLSGKRFRQLLRIFPTRKPLLWR